MPVTIESTEANAPQAAQPTPTATNAVNGTINALTGGVAGGVASLVGGAFNALGNDIFGTTQADKNAEQLKQQAALDQQQLGFNQQNANIGEAESQKLWSGTNSIALADEAAEQGYNPALIYGGSGGGGATVSNPSLQAPEAPDAAAQTQSEAAEANAETGQKAQASEQTVQNAQTQNINTNTQLQQTQIPNIQAATTKIAAETGLTQVQTLGAEINNKFNTIQTEIAKATQGNTEDTITWNSQAAYTNMQLIMNSLKNSDVDVTIKQASMNSIIQSYNLQNQQTISAIIQNYASAHNLKVDADAVSTQLAQGWKELDLQAKGQQVSIENTNKMSTAILEAAGIGAVGQTVNTLLQNSASENINSMRYGNAGRTIVQGLRQAPTLQ
nr:MAG: DNA pilot protein [Microviridae sp.]